MLIFIRFNSSHPPYILSRHSILCSFNLFHLYSKSHFHIHRFERNHTQNRKQIEKKIYRNWRRNKIIASFPFYSNWHIFLALIFFFTGHFLVSYSLIFTVYNVVQSFADISSINASYCSSYSHKNRFIFFHSQKNKHINQQHQMIVECK